MSGSVVRDIIKLAGVKDVTGKILSKTKNKLNNAKAVMLAFSQISSKYTKPIVEEVVVKDDKAISEKKEDVKVINSNIIKE